MPSMPAELALYQEICALSSRMVDAARSNDWERLISLEHRVALLRDEIIAGAGSGLDAAASTPEADGRLGLIQRILEDDAEIRRHVEPWMDHVRQFLGGQSRRRQVQQAYSATDGAPDG